LNQIKFDFAEPHYFYGTPVANAGYHLHLPVGLAPALSGVFFCPDLGISITSVSRRYFGGAQTGVLARAGRV